MIESVLAKLLMLTDDDKELLLHLMFVSKWGWNFGESKSIGMAGGGYSESYNRLIHLGFIERTKAPDREWYEARPTRLFGYLKNHYLDQGF